MERVTHGIADRLTSAMAISALPIIDAAMSYSSDRNIWRLVGIFGWLVFASAWFLRPAIFILNMQENMRRSAELALIGGRGFLVVFGSGLLIVALSLLARHASAA
jgi:hypothetical protein